MRLPVQLRVPLRRSRTAIAALALMAIAAFAAWLSIDAPGWSDAIVAPLLACWAIDRIRRDGLRTSSRSVDELLLSSDALIVVRTRDGRLTAGHVRSASFIHPLLTTIVWRPDGRRLSRSMPIVPDMLDPDDFRRLRVLLRYGRREVTAGVPASQA
jgi:hypothetical protein